MGSKSFNHHNVCTLGSLAVILASTQLSTLAFRKASTLAITFPLGMLIHKDICDVTLVSDDTVQTYNFYSVSDILCISQNDEIFWIHK